MPFVHIEMLAGRSPEAKAAMTEEIRKIISHHANAPEENIHIIFQDIQPENYIRPPKPDQAKS